VSAVYYRNLQPKIGFLWLNLMRTSIASIILLVPAIYFGAFGGVEFAVLSGILNLAVGDSLFLIALRKVGTSIAAPVVYTYVLFVQLFGSVAGEATPLSNLLSSALVIWAVVILSRGKDGSARASGIGFALGASVAYASGNLLVKLSSIAGGNFLSVAFVRCASAAIALGIVTLVSRSGMEPVFGTFRGKNKSVFTVVTASDLAVGSTLIVYSVSTVGVTQTVILSSIAPLLAQVFSKVVGREAPTMTDFLGGLIIVVAIVVAVAV